MEALFNNSSIHARAQAGYCLLTLCQRACQIPVIIFGGLHLLNLVCSGGFIQWDLSLGGRHCSSSAITHEVAVTRLGASY